MTRTPEQLRRYAGPKHWNKVGEDGTDKVTMCKSELLISPLSCIIPDKLFTPGKKKLKGKGLRS